MLKNIEISIKLIEEKIEFIESKEPGVFFLKDQEEFSTEFNAIAFYYLLKLRKLKMPAVSYIDIRLKNKPDKGEFVFDKTKNILFAYADVDFGKYILMSEEEKMNFQYGLFYYLFKEILFYLKIDSNIIEEIKEEIKSNANKLVINGKRKKYGKNSSFCIQMHLKIDCFIFYVVVTKEKKSESFFLTKTFPFSLNVNLLMSSYKVEGNKIIIGNVSQRIFEINTETKEVVVCEKALELVKGTAPYK